MFYNVIEISFGGKYDKRRGAVKSWLCSQLGEPFGKGTEFAHGNESAIYGTGGAGQNCFDG